MKRLLILLLFLILSVAGFSQYTTKWVKADSAIARGNRLYLPDTTQLMGPVYLYPLPDLATKVGRIPVLQTNGKVEWCHPLTLFEEIEDTIREMTIGETPPVSATWVRDTTNGYVVLVHPNDGVGIGTDEPMFNLDVAGNIGAELYLYVGYENDPWTFWVDAVGEEGGRRHVTVGDSLSVQFDSQFDGTVRINENLHLASTTDSKGQVWQNGSRLFHTWTDNLTEPNICLGMNAGNFTMTGNQNIFIGYQAGISNLTGKNNTVIGNGSLQSNDNTGDYNVYIGDGIVQGTGIDNDRNVMVGMNAGALTAYDSCVGVGYQALYRTGSRSTAVGFRAGANGLATSVGNVLIGFQAGLNEEGSNKLYIENSSSASPLIWGDFENDTVRVNGHLDVTGGITGTIINPKGTIADNDSTPSVVGGNVWQYNGTANSVSIDALDDHQVGAFYTIIGNSDTYKITVIDGTPAGGDSFNLAGGNWEGGNQDVLMLYCIAADVFVEISRSDN